jgi:hypothetical protein
MKGDEGCASLLLSLIRESILESGGVQKDGTLSPLLTQLILGFYLHASTM